MSILVTGGAGYIGSHTCVVLLEAGLDVVVVDNLVNSHPAALVRVEKLTGRSLTFHEIDLRDGAALDDVFQQHDVDAVIHFAALKAVGESVAQPLRYYRNNVVGTLTLLETMARHDVHDFVFSSSATVYGDPERVPLDEAAPLSATNPYGWTKLMMEQIMRDAARADARWKAILLRYFNPVGAHPSGHIGEDPSGIPNNLMPFIAQVAVGRREKLRVFGDDYDTPDGTGVRDYIHVMDLAEGHLAALRRLAELSEGAGAVAYNLGTGRGHSVLEVRRAFEEASGRPIPYEIVARRPGDVPTLYADPALAEKELGWKATRSLEEMCADTWRWQSANPHGYRNS